MVGRGKQERGREGGRRARGRSRKKCWIKENAANVVKYRFAGPAERTVGEGYREQVKTANKTIMLVKDTSVCGDLTLQ